MNDSESNRKEKKSPLVTCPNCETRVLPKLDGTCPSCQFLISQKEKGVISKSNAPAKNSEANALKQEPSSITKIKPATKVIDKRSASRGSSLEASSTKKRAPCPKCGEIVVSRKEVRTSKKTGKTLSWFVNLVIGGLLMTLGLLYILILVLAITKNELDTLTLWFSILGISIFFIPGLLLVRAYVNGINSPLFKCAKCRSKWTLRGEEFRQQELAEKEKKLHKPCAQPY